MPSELESVWQVLLRLLGATHMMGLKLRPVSETNRDACGLAKEILDFAMKFIVFDFAHGS